MKWNGYNLNTGAQVWGPTYAPTDAWGTYEPTYLPAYGNIYSVDLGGHVYSINITSGKINWSWHTGKSGTETAMENWPLWIYDVVTIADGKLYSPGGREYMPPLYKGSQLYCLNTTTGDLVWSILGYFVNSAPAISDGYMVTDNATITRYTASAKDQAP